MGVNYGWEKFFNALSYAVSSAASLQERVQVVISGTNHLQRDNFPDEETWGTFKEMLRATSATTSPMTDDEAGKWLRKAFELFSEIAEAYGAQKRSI